MKYKILVRCGGRVYWYNGHFGNLTDKAECATLHDFDTARNVQIQLNSTGGDCLASLVEG